ncbi:MAG: GNAT family N-acetyltransferase [Cyanobacteria bacterium P01_H01_bin.58]
MPPQYRLACESDIPLLVTMMAEFYGPDDPDFIAVKTQQAIADFIACEQYGRLWLIEVETVAVGYLAVTFGFSLEYHGRDAIVDEIYLRAPYRGQGIGTQSFRFLESVCRDLGIKALHLEVMDDNPKAAALYRQLGYEARPSRFLHKWL